MLWRYISLNNSYGTLNDEEILSLVRNKQLITEDFEEKNVKQACYELRAGDYYYDLSSGGKRHRVQMGDVILFKPHQRIVIITKEKMEIPADILARILTKGSLFSVGILPINTYADPGFVGRIGLVLHNSSNDYLKIVSGSAIAKVEFTRLQNPVRNVYHGQHGYETEIWPIHSDYIVEKGRELNELLPNYNEIDEINVAFGSSVANIIQRVLVTERRFLFATIIYIIINLVIIGICMGTEWLSPMISVVLGIVSNLLYAIVSFFISSIRRRKG